MLVKLLVCYNLIAFNYANQNISIFQTNNKSNYQSLISRDKVKRYFPESGEKNAELTLLL